MDVLSQYIMIVCRSREEAYTPRVLPTVPPGGRGGALPPLEMDAERKTTTNKKKKKKKVLRRRSEGGEEGYYDRREDYEEDEDRY